MIMADYKETLKACMEDPGMSHDAVTKAIVLYESDAHDELVRFLRLQRCELVEEMHESQRRVDRMDYLIRQSKKN
jgi:HD superfamily phosphohydrolase